MKRTLQAFVMFGVIGSMVVGCGSDGVLGEGTPSESELQQRFGEPRGTLTEANVADVFQRVRQLSTPETAVPLLAAVTLPYSCGQLVAGRTEECTCPDGGGYEMRAEIDEDGDIEKRWLGLTFQSCVVGSSILEGKLLAGLRRNLATSEQLELLVDYRVDIVTGAARSVVAVTEREHEGAPNKREIAVATDEGYVVATIDKGTAALEMRDSTGTWTCDGTAANGECVRGDVKLRY